MVCQASLSVDFSRQEYWLCVHAQSHPTPGNPIYYSPPGPLSMGFSRQGYWNVLPFPSPEDLPNPGIKPASPAFAGGFFITEPPGKPKSSMLLLLSHSVVSDSSRLHGLQLTRLLHPWDFPGKSTGVGCHCLLHKSSTENPKELEGARLYYTAQVQAMMC